MRLALLTIGLAVTACRGTLSEEPPIHLNPNMDFQDRYELQEENDFFKDRRAMRPQVVGTYAHGTVAADDVTHEHLRQGKVDGKFTDALPTGLSLSADFLNRGQARYQIFCTPCHGGAALGDGMVAQRGGLVVPNLLDQKPRSYTLGQIINQMVVGSKQMPSYAAQVPPNDRWAIAAYVRALQFAGVAPEEQIPAEVKASLGGGAK